MHNFALIESILWSPEPFWSSSSGRTGGVRLDDFVFAAAKRGRPCRRGSTSWEQRYFLLQRHMERLGNSASLFSFVFSKDLVLYELESLDDRLMSCSPAGPDNNIKVRLLSMADGTLSIEYAPVAPLRSLPVGFDISSKMPCEEPVLLAHKTTLRETFDMELERAMAYGLFDTLFVNAMGEITQGCITNVFAAIGRNRMPLITPALESGLLPGTLRAELIVTGLAAEGNLSADMLESAGAVYLGNSVRGLVPARVRCLSSK